MELITNTTDFAAMVRQRRRELGLSQAQVAAKVGVSRQWVIDIEKGKPRAELALTLALLEALGVQLQVKTNKKSQSKELGVNQGEDKIRDLAHAFNFLHDK